jgi:putative transposase
VDETCILVKGVFKYHYRALVKAGKTIDFLLTTKRDQKAALRFFEKAMQVISILKKVTVDKSGANKLAIAQIIEDEDIALEVRQIKHLNNIVEHDHGAVKRNTRPMLGFKSVRAAANVWEGIELMHMIYKGQMAMPRCEGLSFADQFYALAGQVRPA